MHRSLPSLNRHILRVCYLIIALIFAQGTQLHIHASDSHDNQHNIVNADFTDDHQHQGQVHPAHQTSDAAHSQNFATTIDIDFEGFLIKLSLASIVIAFLVASTVLTFPSMSVRTFWRRQKNTPLLNFRRAISPPLRAPPL